MHINQGVIQGSVLGSLLLKDIKWVKLAIPLEISGLIAGVKSTIFNLHTTYK